MEKTVSSRQVNESKIKAEQPSELTVSLLSAMNKSCLRDKKLFKINSILTKERINFKKSINIEILGIQREFYCIEATVLMPMILDLFIFIAADRWEGVILLLHLYHREVEQICFYKLINASPWAICILLLYSLCC